MRTAHHSSKKCLRRNRLARGHAQYPTFHTVILSRPYLSSSKSSDLLAHRNKFYPTRPSRHAHSAKRCHDAALPSPGCHRIPFVLVKRQIRDETMPGLRWPGLLVCRTWNSYSICTSIYPVVTPTFLRRLSRAVCAFPGASCGYSPPLQSLLCTLNIASTDMLPSLFCAQLLPLCRRMFAFQMDIAFPYSVQVSLLYSMFEPPSLSLNHCCAAFTNFLD